MNEVTRTVVTYVPPLAAGVGLGLVYFGGLLITTERLARAERPALLLAASTAARFVAVAVVLALLARGGPVHVVVALLGMIAARTWMVRRVAVGHPYELSGETLSGEVMESDR